ncbi:MAG: electron transfer flavoprotein-ubiquinone oxidoreductase [Pseudomonadota bacterium]|uniref:electron transfer flavoprotein-ubiquinone oxidoreductase n=1 Tax=Qipengyuania flava TaxID=192812 RepID=UPI0007C2F9F0|nr:electron transfer flavoprotein-ubiquinone oxidoreductase [Qipengyuania flava]KZX50517.1 electron transfer flavoprotein-ubiquinone oxidoreductase [Erythrobacter sp. HI00D59]MEC8715680.1 electron transfer flavoprotein-ubiquinone oxidoreductase [Pseudomonadota bacterium]OAN83063.1 electron transfer flavoprotein-ubiquinone oxidoreductase [Erythrobacter sp. EhN03]MBW3168537.1 electron transfer flavoprotein-ubiquinone oxidoreductase [Qipengyuania flava]MBY5965775.1 electron transfer flavoprotein-|tara:strand:- start:301 stop:1950 length:1650 start_codon:yes stop_codon:yes gene_type:complete
MSERESMPCDVVIIGGGVAGLAAAIRLKQINEDLEVVVLEKGSEIGAHILSGAVVDPRALDELLPEWRDMDCPMAETPVTENHHWVLSATGQSDLPEFLLPPFMGNHGNYTGSLGNLARWLGEQAEGLGVMVFPGFPAAEVLFDEQGAVTGVVTQDMGIAEDGSQKSDFQPGMEIHAKYTLFAEGARGNLTKKMKAKYDLEADCEPQVYGLGIKELWDIDPAKHEPGRVIHTQGWPLSETGTWGGGFLYHQANGQVALGFVTALDYKNPYVSPYQEFQRWKHHPAIAAILEGGKRVAYGGRVINEGGWQSVPKLAFPGGALIGCAAGFVNVPRIKGSHTAMKSGMLAAESIAAAIAGGAEHSELMDYDDAVRSSWIAEELQKVKNAQPAVAKWGEDLGTVLAGIDMWMRTLKIGLPITMKHHRDHEMLQRADLHKKIAYPKPDGKLSFDKLTNVAFSYTNHAEDQPVHLKVCDWELQKTSELGEYDGPSNRYCPAGVYEWLADEDTGEMKFQINSQNCIHCKTCDIKDPNQNIEWTTPEGGGGPNYPNM